MESRALGGVMRQGTRGAEPAHPVRVIVLDERQVTKGDVAELIGPEKDFEVVGTTSSAAEALELISRGEADVLVVQAGEARAFAAVLCTVAALQHAEDDLAAAIRALVGSAPGVEGSGGHRRQLLTPREQDVLRLLAIGRSNKQIAAELCLGLRTVESYVSSLIAKLKVSSRTEVALYAVAQKAQPPYDDRP